MIQRLPVAAALAALVLAPLEAQSVADLVGKGIYARALTRGDILDAVWGASVIVTPRSIDRCVTTLRAKIEADPHSPVFIQTVRDIGYRFEA
jgi:uncharacterized protein YbjT (DUF2867 family)